jgi:hypothetical protein
MKQFENEFGGQTICLRTKDRLDDIPLEMRSLILPHVERAFAEPRNVFNQVAKRTTLPNLASYLQAMIANNDWQLVVEDVFMCERVTRVGFYWFHPECYPTTLVLRPELSGNRAFDEMFDLIDATCWDRVGCAGGILPPHAFHPLIDYGITQNNFPSAAKPTIFGTESNGDVFVFCSDGRAGMVSHESGDVTEYESVAECCNWIFGKLLDGEPPEFDWRAC